MQVLRRTELHRRYLTAANTLRHQHVAPPTRETQSQLCQLRVRPKQATNGALPLPQCS